MAGRGLAWLGAAWRGEAGQGRFSTRNRWQRTFVNRARVQVVGSSTLGGGRRLSSAVNAHREVISMSSWTC